MKPISYRLHIRTRLALWVVLVWTVAVVPAQAQDGGAAPPVQIAPADQNGQAAAEPDADAPEPPPDDPYLRYAENVSVRITQMEISDFPTVRAFVSVTDENGILLRSLREDNFIIAENDVPAEARFANRDELDLPLSIQLVLDISGSMDAVVAKDEQGYFGAQEGDYVVHEKAPE